MSNLIPAGNNSLMRSRPRIAGRALARIDERLDIGIATIEAEAQLQAARVEAVGYVGKRAMNEIALVSQLESQLSQLVPAATSRLQAIGDMVALETAEVVSLTVHKVCR